MASLDDLGRQAMWRHERDPVRLVQLARERSLPPAAFLLFSVACCRLVEHLIPVESWRATLPQAELFAEGAIAELDPVGVSEWYAQSEFVSRNVACALYALCPYTLGSVPNLVGAPHHASAVPGFVARAFAGAAAGPAHSVDSPDHPWHTRWQVAYRVAVEWQADLAHCIFGPPDIGAFARHWLSRDVGGLATAARQTRDDALHPLLHDALLEAGCDDESLLEHCRSARHARGCWVLAAVLAAGAV